MADVAETAIEATIVNENPEQQSVPELHKQQSEEKTTNSHHHDSEYDTANYDTSDDDDDDDSLGQEDLDKNDDDEGSSTGSEFDDDEERQRGDGQEQIDYMKKVDEDRSNPQYIPKKGTFYEHDDRTTDEPVSTEAQVTETTEGNENNTKSLTPTITSASKTMKKWQPASGVERWSHDRFEENEQAPKSRAELVSAYGYDIRNEDGPPRSRRRRRYGRGPNKYSRNWEDEGAYIKANNLQRKPLRPDDFPSLGERKGAVKNSRNFKEEKENHYENRKPEGSRRDDGRNGGNNGNSSRNNSNRNIRPSGNRRSQDFKNRNRSNFDGPKRAPNKRQSDNKNTHDNNCYEEVQSQMESLSFTNTKVVGAELDVVQMQAMQQINNDHFNGYENQSFHANHDLQSNSLYNAQSQQVQQQLHQQPDTPIQNSKLTSRLQHHAQQRNDPSHVGSVQMHSLASPPQNQLPQNLVGQNMAELHHAPQEQAKAKRYSSLRQRTSNETPVLQQGPPQVEQQLNLQQIHMQHDAAAQQLLLYHQQEQTQMQSMPLQNLAKTGPAPPQFQSPVPPQYAAPASAFYTAPGDFGHGVATAPSAPPMLQLTAAAAAAYMQQQQTVAAVQSPPIPQTANPPPTPLNYVQPQSATATQNPVAAAPYQNYPPAAPASQYSNYNTVGGTTYFVPHAQPATRTAALPQRRPTNAIPILAPPSDKSKQSSDRDTIGSVENIDHILDNMFVQRASYIPIPTPVPVEPPGINPTLLVENKIIEPIQNEVETVPISDNPQESPPIECITQPGDTIIIATEMVQMVPVENPAQDHQDN